MKLPCTTHLSHVLSIELPEEAQASLLNDFIEQDPQSLGIGGARTRNEGVSVWALIGYLEASGGDIERVADDYGLPNDAIRAALIYFHRNPTVITARIEENRLLRAD